MKFEDLQNVILHLTLLYPNKFQEKIDSLSNLEGMNRNSVAFVKTLNFEKFKENYGSEECKTSGLIIEAKFAEKLLADKQDEWSQLIENVAFVGQVADVNLAMSWMSKPFYERVTSEWNDDVDGRQMGTAEVHPTAVFAQNVFIGHGVKIGANVRIHSGAVILSGSVVGDNSEIYPNVTVYQNVKIGKNVRLHAGSSIGADGFGYNHQGGIHHKVWHMGGAIIEDDVEVGANSCIDQGTFSPTVIGAGTKLDNHVQIGHNCRLGRGVIICGHVAIGGSTKIGDYCVWGGKSGSGDNLTLGAGCQIAGGALVNCDWPDGSVVGGHPARPLKEWMKGLAYVRKESLKK